MDFVGSLEKEMAWIQAEDQRQWHEFKELSESDMDFGGSKENGHGFGRNCQTVTWIQEEAQDIEVIQENNQRQWHKFRRNYQRMTWILKEIYKCCMDLEETIRP